MSKPNVLVGIPTLNNPTCLKRCLDAIAESTSFDTDYNVKVLVCDDCSSPENLAANKTIIHNATARIPGLEMLMNTERRGVSTTWNTLVRHYRDANEIVLLNDDVEVVPDWLDVLVYSVLMNDRAGMIGLNTNVGTTKEQAGPQLRSEYNEATLFDGNGELVSSFGPIFAFRRSDFDAVHGFDEGFFVFYEEIDFGLRLALELGRTNLIASFTWAAPRPRSLRISTPRTSY